MASALLLLTLPRHRHCNFTSHLTPPLTSSLTPPQDGNGLVTQMELEAAMQTLGFPGLDTTFIRKAMRDAGCAPRE